MILAVVLTVIIHNGTFGDQVSFQGFEDEEACNNAAHVITSTARNAETFCLPAAGHRPVEHR